MWAWSVCVSCARVSHCVVCEQCGVLLHIFIYSLSYIARGSQEIYYIGEGRCAVCTQTGGGRAHFLRKSSLLRTNHSTHTKGHAPHSEHGRIGCAGFVHLSHPARPQVGESVLLKAARMAGVNKSGTASPATWPAPKFPRGARRGAAAASPAPRGGWSPAVPTLGQTHASRKTKGKIEVPEERSF